MLPTLGWTLLSQDVLRRAETQLRDDVQGVRDEIGFLLIHQAYADHFFPGTSVLQTRLRYALIVPWLYRKVADYAQSGQSASALRQAEVKLVGRLLRSGDSGIIGGRSYPQPSSQQASMIYWTALRAWGILRSRFDGSFPPRYDALRAMCRRRPSSVFKDDDAQPLEVMESVFAGLPKPPKVWERTDQPFSLKLDDGRPPGDETEVSFLRQQLIGVVCPNTRNQPALLSVLVEANVSVGGLSEPWATPVLDVLGAMERAKLLRAQQMAALAAIGRGVYGALVETVLEQKDDRPASGQYDAQLRDMIAKYGQEATKLDVGALHRDIPRLPSYLQTVLAETQRWLSLGQKDVAELYEPYRDAEIRRKGLRARLPDTLNGRQRRQESTPPRAYPLSYRWTNVQRLLRDLEVVRG